MPLLQVPGTPGCRYALRTRREPWAERDLAVIGTERPGFGASDRLPGRGFAEHADDLVAVLDASDIESVLVIGGSGAAPHELCFAARHPDRVRAVSVVGGRAPSTKREAATMVPISMLGWELAQAGGARCHHVDVEPAWGGDE